MGDLTPSLTRRAPVGLVKWEVKDGRLHFIRSEQKRLELPAVDLMVNTIGYATDLERIVWANGKADRVSMENSSRNQGEYPECTDKSLEFRKKRKECDSCFVISEACIALCCVVLFLPSYVLRPQTMVTNLAGVLVLMDKSCTKILFEVN